MSDPARPWDRRVGQLPRLADPPSSKGFVSDAELKRRIRVHMGAKPTPFPRDLERSRLVEVACGLNLVSEGDALLSAPRKSRGPVGWDKRVEQAAPRDRPSFDGVGFVTDRQLKGALEAHIGDGVRAPESIGRSKLLAQALAMNLLSEEAAGAPAPSKIDTADLRKMWVDDAKAGRDVNPPRSREGLLKALLEAGKLTEAEADAKAVRADRSLAMQENRLSVQACRRTSVAALFRGLPNAGAVKAALVDMSEKASRLFYQRSFLVWLHLARLVEEGGPLPDMEGDQLDRFVRQAYTIGTAGSLVKNPELEKTLAIHKQLFPVLPRPDQANLITHAANTYAGAMRRHFANADTVKQRIKRFAASKLFGLTHAPPAPGEEDADGAAVGGRPDVGDSPLYNIVSALECKTFQEDAMHPRQLEVLADVRRILGLRRGTELDSNWLRANIHDSIRFSLVTVKAIDDLRAQASALQLDNDQGSNGASGGPRLKKGCTRGLHFVPLNALKRRFVTVDATDLAPLLGLPSEGPLIAQAVREMLLPNVRAIYGEKMAHHPDAATSAGGAWYLTGTFDTDGFSIHPHFKRRKTPEEAASKAPLASRPARDSAPPKVAKAPRLLILADPGRVNLVTMTVMLDGKVVMKTTAKGRQRPLKFTFTTRQYYALTGATRARIIREKRARKDAVGAPLRAAQSSTSLRTGDYQQVVGYVKAGLDHASASGEAWARALKKGAATERWRREAAKEGELLKWFHGVQRSVKRVTGLSKATVVWGCKVAATGRGNLSAPTERSAALAARVNGWTLVRGDEYKTSALSCEAPHTVNLAPRFRGKVSTVGRSMPRPKDCSHEAAMQCLRSKVRSGWVETLSAMRTLRRASKDGKNVKPIGESGLKKPRPQTKWEYEGNSSDSAGVKAAKKAERQEEGLVCKYVRGLRVFTKDQDTTKFVDRDVNGSINIGLLWLSDNVSGRSRPEVFKRPKKSAAPQVASSHIPAQNSG